MMCAVICVFFFFSSRRRHTRFDCDWSSDVCSSDLFINVDFPAPFAPTIACTSPLWQVSVTSCSTVVPKNRLVMRCMDSTGAVAADVIAVSFGPGGLVTGFRGKRFPPFYSAPGDPSTSRRTPMSYRDEPTFAAASRPLDPVADRQHNGRKAVSLG